MNDGFTMNCENSRRKIVFVLIDGVGDVSIPSLGAKSPLEASTCPVLDSIASAFMYSCYSLLVISNIPCMFRSWSFVYYGSADECCW
jgi:hypothetical protein